jgi:signal-transduction protein with cAMP-binding, CBS, and nucleotidyltransferase domain
MHRHIGDLVTNRGVVSLSAGASVRQAACRMKDAHVASVVVMAPDDEHLSGIFTERDLTERVVASGLDPDSTPLAAVMTPCPITVDLDTTVRDAMRGMIRAGLRHLPVADHGHIVGVVSTRDFMGEELGRGRPRKGNHGDPDRGHVTPIEVM